MKIKVYFSDLTHTGIGINANYFPLGMGLVAAYAAKELKNEVDFKLFKFPSDLSNALQQEVPDILCFCNYAWNMNLSYTFANYVKQSKPKVITIFGGPNFPIIQEEKKAFLEKRPAIDFYVRGEGEVALVSLLRELLDKNLDTASFKRNKIIIENISYSFDDDYMEGRYERVKDLTVLPSPYLMGLMDEFFEYPLIPLIETTRGCPYSCTYCNDGNASRRKIYRRTNEFIREELEYIASKSNKTSQLMLSDLNFGMFKEDIDTSLIIQSVIKKYNWPDRVQVGFGKSQPKRLIEVTRIINEGNRGVIRLGASFQSTDPEVLRYIKRKNLSLEELLQMKEYRSKRENENLEFFTEIILALPGDTVEKHYKSLEDVIDVLRMNNIDVHQLSLLLGSELALPKMRREFRFDVRHRVFVGCVGIYRIENKDVPCAEIEEVVVGNNTLSFDDYIECRIISLLVKIYVDNEPFKEVVGLIRKLNLSVFDVLKHLKDRILFGDSFLSTLIKSFIECTSKSLFDSYEEAIKFVLNIENTKRFLAGEYGQNEILTHRARAYVDYCDETHAAFKKAVLSYLKEKDSFNDVLQEYVEQAIEFRKLRAFDLKNIKTIKEGIFTFDFIKAGTYNYEIDPAEFKISKTKYKFYHDNDDLVIIQRWIDSWGMSTIHQIGKLFQKSNALVMRRKVCEVNQVLSGNGVKK